MAEIAFDTLQYARRLKAAGVPMQQAEVQAELIGEAFGYYVGNLVTRDYLDATLKARFAEQEAHLDRVFSAVKSQLRWHNWILALLVRAILLPRLSALIGT